MKRFILPTLSALALISSAFHAPGEDAIVTKGGFKVPRYLRGNFTDGFVEYGFRDGGRLFDYSYAQGDTESRLAKHLYHLRPMFEISLLKWDVDEGRSEIILQKGDFKGRSHDAGHGEIVFGEMGMLQVDHLKFFDKLWAYTDEGHASPGKKPTGQPKPRFHFLHTDVLAPFDGAPITRLGFLEYQFFTDGKLLAYFYTKENSDSVENVPSKLFQSRFKVESLRWQMEGNRLIVQRGPDKKIMMFNEGEMDGRKLVHVDDKEWERVEHLEFFDKLAEECGHSRQQNATPPGKSP